MNNLWRCNECGKKTERSLMLEGVNPFDETDYVLGCPGCRACNPPWIEVCDEPGCERQADCGTPTDGGYRRTCGRHAPNA
jgi:hypothetical protein